MNLNDLLLAKSVPPEEVLVLRHRPFEPELNKVLPWLAAEKPEVFNAYQQTQPFSVFASDGYHGVQKRGATMTVQDQVVASIQTWAGVTVDLLSGALCDLWLKNHTSCDDPAFQLLLQQVRKNFPNRKIGLVPADFIGDAAAVKTVQSLVDAVQTSELVEA